MSIGLQEITASLEVNKPFLKPIPASASGAAVELAENGSSLIPISFAFELVIDYAGWMGPDVDDEWWLDCVLPPYVDDPDPCQSPLSV